MILSLLCLKASLSNSSNVFDLVSQLLCLNLRLFMRHASVSFFYLISYVQKFWGQTQRKQASCRIQQTAFVSFVRQQFALRRRSCTHQVITTLVCFTRLTLYINSQTPIFVRFCISVILIMRHRRQCHLHAADKVSGRVIAFLRIAGSKIIPRVSFTTLS